LGVASAERILAIIRAETGLTRIALASVGRSGAITFDELCL
jgi:hypothetical protein